LFPDAGHLVVFAIATKEVLVRRRFPGAETWARAGACGAALLAMQAVVETEFFFDMEGLVLALFMFVSDDVVWTCHHAASTSGAEPRVDDFFVELFPLRCPALGFGRCIRCHGHATTLGARWRRLHVRPYGYG